MFPAQDALPMPPRRLQVQAGAAGVFHEVPLMFLAWMNLAGLEPTDRVLELGCSCGRIARYLCAYLDEGGSYEGFDIVSELIDWCTDNISPTHPNFHFTFTPMYNTHYSTDESLPRAEHFRFPYDDASFDFVCANSVFTHLEPASARNYIQEMARVLRPGGTTCTTWFWYNLSDDGYSNHYAKSFVPDADGSHAFVDPLVPERAVAYTDTWVRAAYADAGLTIREPLYRGYRWIQDLCIADKPR